MSPVDIADIPQDIVNVAEKLGLDVQELLTAAEKKAAAEQQGTGAAIAAGGAAAGAPIATAPASVEEGVTVSAGETDVQRLERELAVSQDETQKVRKLAATASEGRVVGSGGGAVPGQAVDPPNLGGIEPGIRWLVRNGVIAAEDLEGKVAPLIIDLFKQDAGGVI